LKKHGMTNIGYWVPTDEPRSKNTLIYILAHASREAAKKSWTDSSMTRIGSRCATPRKPAQDRHQGRIDLRRADRLLGNQIAAWKPIEFVASAAGFARSLQTLKAQIVLNTWFGGFCTCVFCGGLLREFVSGDGT